MTTKKGYLVALVVLVLGLGGSALFMWHIYQRVDAMDRVELPGTETVELPAGDLVAYAEPAPGTASSGDFQVSARCKATDAAGADVALTIPRARTSYTLGGRRGASMFALTVPQAGPVTITCESGDRFVMAIGRGVGASIAGAVVCALGGGLTALVLGLRTWWRRRRERGAAAATRTAPQPG